MADGSDRAGYDGYFDRRSGRSAEEVVEMVVGRLESEALDRVSKKNIVEVRWIEDLTQYEGRYGHGEESRLSSGGRSAAFVNETRPKTLACESKLYDLLFPTDDRNWGIRPTPVPMLAREAEEAVAEAEELTDQANSMPDDGQAQALARQAQEAADRGNRAQAVMDEAKKRADLMSDEIADHLVECDYAAECRDVIHDACVLGTGILKGPLARTERIRRNWLKNDRGDYELQFREGAERLIFHRVSPWNLFPDPTALTFEDSEDWFERHLLKAKDLRRMARLPNVNVDAIEELLEEGPQGTVPNYIDQMQSISNEKMESNRQRFVFWEYRGALDREEMGALFRHFGMDDEADDIDEISPLFALDCVVWFCQGRAVRFAVNHLDSNAAIYSFFTLEKNESRLWGVGIPWIMRQPQAIVNAAWRIMLDNAAISSFPQTEVDTEVIEPAEGDDYGLRSRKVWLRKAGAQPDKPGIKFHEIPTRQPEMASIIEIAKTFIDKETSISVIAEGEQGTTTKTAGGMTLLMNAVNVVFRRIVKNFDDGITEPSLERAYDYQMQYSPKDEIKGDYQVQARGSSVLLVREIQAQNLLLLATEMIPHPILGKYFRPLPVLVKLTQSMMIPGDDVLRSKEEVDALEAAEAEQGPDPALLQLQMQGELEQAKLANALEIAMLEHEQAMMTLASQENVKMEDIAARLTAIREQSASRLAGIREQSASRERQAAAEIAIDSAKPPGASTAGGLV